MQLVAQQGRMVPEQVSPLTNITVCLQQQNNKKFLADGTNGDPDLPSAYGYFLHGTSLQNVDGAFYFLEKRGILNSQKLNIKCLIGADILVNGYPVVAHDHGSDSTIYLRHYAL